MSNEPPARAWKGISLLWTCGIDACGRVTLPRDRRGITLMRARPANASYSAGSAKLPRCLFPGRRQELAAFFVELV